MHEQMSASERRYCMAASWTGFALSVALLLRDVGAGWKNLGWAALMLMVYFGYGVVSSRARKKHSEFFAWGLGAFGIGERGRRPRVSYMLTLGLFVVIGIHMVIGATAPGA